MLLTACADMNYDTTDGRLDKEITLFNDQVSVPVGDIGPLSLGILIDKAGYRESIQSFVKEDSDGYLVLEKEGDVYNNVTMFMAATIADPTKPADFSVADFKGNIETMSSLVTMLGIAIPRQSFSLTATNPLTDEIGISGKVSLLAEAKGDLPAGAVVTQEFSQKKVAAGANKAVFFEIDSDSDRPFTQYEVSNLQIHLPASLSEKDPLSGMSVLTLGYIYKAYLALGDGFSFPLSHDLDNLNVPLGQFRVKEATIRTEVSSELPMALTIDKLEVLVEKVDEDGKKSVEPLEDIVVSTPISIAPGSTGNPVISPLEIEIRSITGTIPDITAIRLEATIQNPTDIADKRLGMNQKVYFNNLRATVSGGITIQNL